MVVWPRSLFALHVHERLSYQASDIEHRGVQRSLALQHHMHNLIRPPLLLLRRPQHLCCILSLLRICSHRVAPFFLIASFDTDDLEGSHSPISTRFRISSASTICESLGWVRANGNLKSRECYEYLDLCQNLSHWQRDKRAADAAWTAGPATTIEQSYPPWPRSQTQTLSC